MAAHVGAGSRRYKRRLDEQSKNMISSPQREARMFSSLQSWLYKRSFERKIRQHGWTAIEVGDGRSGPVWAYTVGMGASSGGPELIVFGQPMSIANGLFWEAHRQFKTGNLVLRDGEVWRDLAGFDCAWRKVHPSQISTDVDWLLAAIARHHRITGSPEGLEAFQIFVPDEAGKYPWEEGFDEGFRRYQEELYRPLPDDDPRR
ncbi:MAG TPA: DUF4262 domain-containing protein, partial [Phenylobacterium sp.]|uniref:DUF4262 domain-containing protein n=1 Tax=Phenylobacterium sp. TaxID=1871053 RepID=UPI002D2FCA63